MTHPCIHYLDADSPPRILFSGDQFLIEHLPPGTRCIYPKPPMQGLKDPDAAIRYAINHPENSEPLHALLSPGMKVTIAFDDVSVPLPPMKKPDVRQRIIEIVLEILADHGVDDIHLIAALAVHRRMTEAELKHTVGERVFREFYPDRLYNHDAEDPDGMVQLGTTDSDEVVDINRRAAESDLLIYVNVNFVPMDGGHKSVAVGLCGYKALRAHHNPKTLRKSNSYMDPPNSELHHSVDRQGRIVNSQLKVFTIETVVNNRSFGGQLDFLMKREEDLTDFEWQKARAIKATLDRLPQPARQELFYAVPAPYELIAVHAGETEAVHRKTLVKAYEQYAVPVKGQSDIVIFGVPFISPYNIGSYLNPLLVQVMAQGYLHNLYRGVPLLKKGGTLIVTHPMEDRFDPVQHAPYIEFVHRLLPETRDAFELHKRYERQFAEDPTYVELYRRGNAYHGSHPFFMWYWGEAGRQHIGRVIVAGAKDDYMCELFGYEPAANLQEAIAMARDTAPASPDISLFTSRSIYLCDVTPSDAPSNSDGAIA
ncbi:MAG: lactate racemase domain-containing protein [Myxococcota bacterium]